VRSICEHESARARVYGSISFRGLSLHKIMRGFSLAIAVELGGPSPLVAVVWMELV